jgi:ketosteroid isomerase-like protein
MSQENIEVVRRAWEAVERGDLESAAHHVDPNAEIHDFDIPDGGIYHGQEGFLTWNAHWGEGWETWRIEDLELRPVGEDQVLALFRMVARGAGSGIEIDRLDAIAYKVREARIVRLEYFNDRRQALEVVGLVA